jgi:RNA polymerase sigma-70 factor (ECF subfamily)
MNFGMTGAHISGIDDARDRQERTRWFLRNILPHEPALRKLAGPGHPAGLEIDDIIQEAYAVLADLDTVEGIRIRAPICFRSPVR